MVCENTLRSQKPSRKRYLNNPLVGAVALTAQNQAKNRNYERKMIFYSTWGIFDKLHLNRKENC
jgi:hypothetical protein